MEEYVREELEKLEKDKLINIIIQMQTDEELRIEGEKWGE